MHAPKCERLVQLDSTQTKELEFTSGRFSDESTNGYDDCVYQCVRLGTEICVRFKAASEPVPIELDTTHLNEPRDQSYNSNVTLINTQLIYQCVPKEAVEEFNNNMVMTFLTFHNSPFSLLIGRLIHLLIMVGVLLYAYISTPRRFWPSRCELTQPHEVNSKTPRSENANASRYCRLEEEPRVRFTYVR